jgi:AcrR family transcriptional regulator
MITVRSAAVSSAERRRREKENLRRAILDAARELFVSEGYDNVSMRKIADRIEYSPTTIYLYFKDKDEILVALCEEGFQMMAGCLEALDVIDDPIERLRQGGVRYFDFAREQPHYYTIMFEMKENALEKKHPEIGEEDPNMAGKAGHRAFACIVRCIEEGIAQGRIVPTAPAAVLAHVFWASIHGAASLMLSGRLGMLPDEAQPTFFASVVENAVRGLLARPSP